MNQKNQVVRQYIDTIRRKVRTARLLIIAAGGDSHLQSASLSIAGESDDNIDVRLYRHAVEEHLHRVSEFVASAMMDRMSAKADAERLDPMDAIIQVLRDNTTVSDDLSPEMKKFIIDLGNRFKKEMQPPMPTGGITESGG